MGANSHYTKATLFFRDITDSTFPVRREQGFTLQSFSYECSRQRNTEGNPYGPTQATLLQFSLKSLPDGYLKELYQRLTENTASSFSVVFDACFRMSDAEGPVLYDYDNALVVTGSVVDINEVYDALNLYETDAADRVGAATHDLMTTTVSFLLQSITYIGNNNYKKELPIHY